MQIGMIDGMTRVLGKSQGYLGLPIRDEQSEDGSPSMSSAWHPTPDEIERIATGAPVYLTIQGQGHPPVMLWVGEAPKEA
jgi:hypothetical protein